MDLDRRGLPLAHADASDAQQREGPDPQQYDRPRKTNPESSCQRTPLPTQIIAAICCIEIPRNEWPGIAEKITQNIASEDNTVKEVSILTIGFICEQLKEFNFYFEEPLQETILTGIFMGVKDPHPETSEIAFKALRDGLPAMTSIMKNLQVREFLISQLADALNNKHNTDYALQALIEFVKYNFPLLLPQYVEGLANIIEPILRNT